MGSNQARLTGESILTMYRGKVVNHNKSDITKEGKNPAKQRKPDFKGDIKTLYPEIKKLRSEGLKNSAISDKLNIAVRRIDESVRDMGLTVRASRKKNIDKIVRLVKESKQLTLRCKDIADKVGITAHMASVYVNELISEGVLVFGGDFEDGKAKRLIYIGE